jgi:HEAT repeat protein
VSILLLPLSLISGTAALLLSKGVWAGVLLKGSDGALKHSLDRSCRELMYLPVPKHVKVQTKSTIDTVMDRLGDGTAGALQLVLVEGIGAGLGASLFVNLIVVFVWLGLAFRLKGEYVTQLRTTLAAPGGEDVAIGGLADEAEARRILDGLLAAGSEQEKLAALEWTSHARPGAVDEKRLLALARADGSPAVRRAALAVLLGGGDVDLPEGLVEGLEEEGQAALVSAIDVVIEADAEGSADRLSALLGRSGETTRLPLLAFMVRRLGPEFEPFAVRVFDALLAPGVPSRSRRDAVRSLALLPAGASPLLRLPELLRDPDPQVAGAAAEVVASRDVPDLLPSLVELLGRPGARPAARRALSAFGTRAQEPLVAALRDGAHARAVRRQVPSLLAAVPASNAIEALAEGLRDADPVVADRCLGALGEVRRKNVGPLPFRAAWVGREAVEQARRYADAARLRDEVAAASTGPSDALRWVADALESERARALKGVFAVLAVEYPIYDMRGICLAVSEGGGVERANALELLANVLPHPLSGTLVPVLERALQGGTGTPPPGGRPGRAELLGSLARSPVPWIAATALHAARVSGVTGIEAAARAAARSADPAVREEAEALLGTAHEGVPA